VCRPRDLSWDENNGEIKPELRLMPTRSAGLVSTLDWRWHQRALELGCMMSINPDAHSTAEIDLTHWGVEMARKGGVPQDRVLNCLELSAFTQYLAERRRKAKSTARRR